MEDPLDPCDILPLPRFQQITHDGYRADTAHVLGRLGGRRETVDLMTVGQKDPDQRRAEESSRSRDESGRRRGACHVASVKGAQTQNHAQRPHTTRTPSETPGAVLGTSSTGRRAIGTPHARVETGIRVGEDSEPDEP